MQMNLRLISTPLFRQNTVYLRNKCPLMYFEIANRILIMHTVVI